VFNHGKHITGRPKPDVVPVPESASASLVGSDGRLSVLFCFILIKAKVAFWRTGFFPANQGFLKLFTLLWLAG